MYTEKDLLPFYKSYQEWLDNGAPHNGPYCRMYGLCDALSTYYRTWKPKPPVGDDFLGQFSLWVKDEEQFKGQMLIQFYRAGLDLYYPFREYNYNYLEDRFEQHLDKNRIKWVELALQENTSEFILE